jgi:hypothetical protein
MYGNIDRSRQKNRFVAYRSSFYKGLRLLVERMKYAFVLACVVL